MKRITTKENGDTYEYSAECDNCCRQGPVSIRKQGQSLITDPTLDAIKKADWAWIETRTCDKMTLNGFLFCPACAKKLTIDDVRKIVKMVTYDSNN